MLPAVFSGNLNPLKTQAAFLQLVFFVCKITILEQTKWEKSVIMPVSGGGAGV
jgi:hypothetical protein